ncbi:MAG: Rhodoferax phage [Pseudomonadota bacterium]|jgi:hypothetical protein
MRVPFIGGTKASRSLNVNAQRTINLYPEVDASGKAQVVLYGTPGLRPMTMGSDPTITGGIRAMCVLGDTLMIIHSSGQLRRISPTEPFPGVIIGGTTLPSGVGPVSIASNGTVAIAADGQKLWLIKKTDGYVMPWVVPTIPSPSSVAFIDGYFVVTDSSTDRFFISGLNESESWDALDFASAEANPDKALAVATLNRELWVFGSESVEPFYNSGDADFPFARVGGAYIDTGTAAPRSVARVDNSLIWLSKSDKGQGQVVRAQGYTPQVISSRAIEETISRLSRIDDAFAWTYQQNGHPFYVLTFPSAGKTFVYDVSVQDPEVAWHERETFGKSQYRPQCHAFYRGAHYVGDFERPRVYKIDPDFYLDDDQPILRSRTGQYLQAERNRMFFSSFEIDVEAGVGLSTGQGVDPQVWLEWSDDGGHTWSSQIYRSLGAIGKTRHRVIWRKLGSARQRIFRVSTSDPVKIALIDGFVEFSSGGA